MVSLSPKLKVLIAVAVTIIVALIVTVVAVVVTQKNNVAKAQSVSFKAANQKLMVGEIATLDVEVAPQNAQNKGVRFWSTDTSVFVVEESGESQVRIRAVGLGEALLMVESTANNKLKDSCSVQVSDMVGHEIECPSGVQSAVVGQEVKLPVSLLPAGSNLQKLVVKTFDQTVFSSASVVVEGSEAYLVAMPITAGSGTVVLEVQAQTQNGNVGVLTKQLVFDVKEPSVSQFTFEVKSTGRTDSVSQAISGNKFILPANNTGYTLTFDFMYALENESQLVGIYGPSLSWVTDSSLLRVRRSGNSVLVSAQNTSVSWSQVALRFEYCGKVIDLTLYKEQIPSDQDMQFKVIADGAGTQSSPYVLSEGRGYQLQFEKTASLVSHGFMTYSVANQSEYVSVSGYQLTALKPVESQIITLTAHFEYWDTSLVLNVTNVDVSVYVTITEFEFQE